MTPQNGKTSERNDLFDKEDIEENENIKENEKDKLMEGVTVRLRNKKTNEIVTINGEKAEKKTDKNGAYQFVDVLIEELENYYIEFEYDGLVYTNVVAHLDKDNGSKSSENATERAKFNDTFSYIEDNGKQADNIGQARNSNGEVSHNDLYYNRYYNDEKELWISELDHSKSIYDITANTDEAGYKIKDQFKAGMEEIKNINLGLQEREQPDLSLKKGLYNAIVSVNGYSHTYYHNDNFDTDGKFNVDVKFGTHSCHDSEGNIITDEKGNRIYSTKYSQPIYPADVQTDFDNQDNELKVYVTYKLQVINEATTLKSRVNRIADYYDINYEVIEVGTGLDEKGAITGKLENHTEKYNDKYNKLTINTSDTDMINGINTGSNDEKNYLDIYVRFRMNRETVKKLFLEDAPLDNTAEIESYSTFDTNGKIYAGIDKDSAPGNTIPGEESTHEDDDWKAPSFVLCEAGARSMSGNVFEDIKGANQALGDGIYNSNSEHGIEGIKVTIKTNETGNSSNTFSATTNTDSNGEYTFVGPYSNNDGNFKNFIPGEYIIEFEWGGQTYTVDGTTTKYTVQNYKGTTQPKDEWNRKNTNLEWYKENVEERYTDAIDNGETRKDIDNNLKTIVYGNATNIDTNQTMIAATAKMKLGIEINSTNTIGEKFEYKIKNIDYGIIKRPDQDIQLDKRVSTVKLTLANGQVLIDATIDEQGNITGEKRNLKYIESPKPGQIHIELDNELMQGSTLEVGYEFKATNIGEEDYQYDKYTDYYNFGISGNENYLVTLTPAAIIDYLDRDWGYDGTINTQWSEKTEEQIQNMTVTINENEYKIFAPEVYGGTNTDIANTRILYTEALKENKLKPEESATTNLVVSKLLTTSDEIDLSNQTEVIKVTKTGGGVPISTPGNFVPGTSPNESDESESEKIIVTPPTGSDNITYVIYSAIGVLALAILGTGIVVIKKKILK